MKRFEEVIAWQKSRELCKAIYVLFKSTRDFSFRDQICRAVVSIGNNIAEGFERSSNKELKQFLYIAKGSAAEVRSMLYSALDLQYITQKEFNTLISLTEEISRILSGFIKTL